MSHEGLNFTGLITERPLSSWDVSLSKLHRNSCWTKGKCHRKISQDRINHNDLRYPVNVKFSLDSHVGILFTQGIIPADTRYLLEKQTFSMHCYFYRRSLRHVTDVSRDRCAPKSRIFTPFKFYLLRIFHQNTVWTSKISHNEVDNSFYVAWRGKFPE